MCYIKAFKLFICGFAVYSFIFEFNLVKAEITSAVTMWISVIIPSVFPYLVLSKYIISTDAMDIFEIFPGKLMSRIFKLSQSSIKAVICSLFCGYPSGAVCASSLLKEGLIQKDEAKRIITFTNNAGPLFLISAVGISMLGSAKDGFAIYVIQIISAFIYGITASIKSPQIRQMAYVSKSVHSDLCEAIRSSVATITNICGYMISAYVMSCCVLIFADKVITSHMAGWTEAFIKGFFEITQGIKSIASPGTGCVRFGIICAFVSWSGISVIMQIKSVAGDIISFRTLMYAKCMQAILSFGLGYLYKMVSGEAKPYIRNEVMIELSFIITVILFLIYLFKTRKKAM